MCGMMIALGWVDDGDAYLAEENAFFLLLFGGGRRGTRYDDLFFNEESIHDSTKIVFPLQLMLPAIFYSALGC